MKKDCISIDKKDKLLILRNGIIMIIGSILVSILIIFDRNLTFVDSIILLIFYIVFIIIVVFTHKMGITEFEDLDPYDEEVESRSKRSLFLISLICLCMIILCSYFMVGDILYLMYNVPSFNKYAFLLIGIAIALPDLILSVIAIKKGKEEMAIGLVIGGVIWDMVISICLQGIINPLYNISEIYIILFLIMSIAGTVIALIYIRTEWQLKLWECIILILIYIGLLIFVFLYI